MAINRLFEPVRLSVLLIVIAFLAPGCVAEPEEDATIVTRSNGAVTFEIAFINPVKTGKRSERRDWTEADMAPVLAGVERWLSVVTGIEAYSEEYTISLSVRANRDEDNNGSTGVEVFERVAPDVYLPRYADLMISGDMFSDSWSEPRELELTILHELGHVLGIGTAFHIFEYEGYFFSGPYPIPDEWPYKTVRNWLTPPSSSSAGRTGYVYRQLMGVAAYNRVHGTSLDFLPISADGGHLFTIEYDPAAEEIIRTPWKLPGGAVILPMEAELMGHGAILSEITLGVLQDLGWTVDMSQAEPYTPLP